MAVYGASMLAFWHQLGVFTIIPPSLPIATRFGPVRFRVAGLHAASRANRNTRAGGKARREHYDPERVHVPVSVGGVRGLVS